MDANFEEKKLGFELVLQHKKCKQKLISDIQNLKKKENSVLM
jgi:hypothetical protein